MILLFTIELSAVVALVAILAWEPEIQGRHIRRLVVVLWGTTAYGFVHGMAEYTIMIHFSDANWHSPPGTGHFTVAVITICAILTAIMTLSAPRPSADEPHQDNHSASLSLT